VIGFFIISGYLVFQSLERSNNIVDYFWKRFLRLFPGLLTVLLITVLLAPFVYKNSTVPYLENKSMWTYVPNNLSLYRMQYGISGVFETNPYKSVINGSLWTIPYEFTMYALLSLLIFFRKYQKITKNILLFSFSLLVIANIFFFEQLGKYGYVLSGKHLLDLGVFFVSGSLLAVVKIDKFKFVNATLYFAIILLFISLIFNFAGFVKYLILPIIVIVFGQKSTPVINSVGSTIGDLSYGIYIYAFPVQQTLVYYFKLNYIYLMLFSFVISFILAYMSWHLLESKALKLKKLHITAIWHKDMRVE